MAVSPLASLLAQTQPGGIVNTAAPLAAATTGYAAPQAPPTVQAVTAAPKTPVVQVPSLALAAAAKATPGPNLVGEYKAIGAKAKAAQAGTPTVSATGTPGRGSAPTGAAGADPSANKVVSGARSFLGIPYLWGGTDPKVGIDCSAFVQQAYAKAGISIPRTTYTQYAAGSPVALNKIQPGDAVFVEPEGKSGQPGHVGLFIGNGLVQESPHKGEKNQIVSLSAFLQDGFVGVRRF